jgi:hypothetical protein
LQERLKDQKGPEDPTGKNGILMLPGNALID